ncbi:MAG: HAMP domain-containing sensor histidine kinase, partial [Actinomycetes bacterium]
VVSDRGPGISPDDRAEAMEPFRRLDDSGAGSGLGLSVAKGFLEVLGGSIHLDETPGGGLTVVMEIVGAVDR